MSQPAAPSPPPAPAPAEEDAPAEDEGRIGDGRYGKYTPLALAGLIVLTLLVIGLVRAAPWADDPPPAPGPRPSDLPGKPAPEFTLTTLDGRQIRLADLRADGSVVVVNFWASWCDPCAAEAPVFERIATAGSVDGAPVKVVGVGIKLGDSDAADRSFVQQHGLTYPIGRDSGGTDPRRGPIQLAFGQDEYLPLTIVIRPNGIVAAVHFGQLDEPTLRAAIRAAAG